MNYKEFEYIIGIDPGVNTGLSIWCMCRKELVKITSVTHHQAVTTVKFWASDSKVLVRFEDARKRTWFGKAGREQLQGAGSIKRDCQLWEEFLTDNNIPFEAVAPKNNKTKLTAELFKKYTGWTGKTNEHGRDSAMLVYNL